MRKYKKSEFEQLVDEHLKIALLEIGQIKPWFDAEFQSWAFRHELYPVEYYGNTKREVIKNYPLYMREFIEQRLKNNLSPLTEKETKGRGGKRPGAGRPVGTTKEPTAVIRLPLEIVQWIKADSTHIEQLRALSSH
jgi:hypothetical protein